MIFIHLTPNRQRGPKTINTAPAIPFKRIATILLLFFFSLVLSTSQAAEVNALRNIHHGDKLPKFSLRPLEGGTPVQFIPDQGKPTALMFFSIRPDFRKKRSLALLSELAALSEKYKNKVDIISIYVDYQDEQIVLNYMRDSVIKLPVLQDPNRDIYNLYGIFMMPLVIFITPEGTLHEVIPYTYNIKELVDGNLKLLLGEWTLEQLQESLKPKEIVQMSKEEKEYIRRINYGRVMSSRKMYSQAQREFSTAVKLLPEAIAARIELGFLYITKEEYAKAEQSFREALQREADSDDALAGLGLALFGQKNFKEALPRLENAFIAHEPKLEVIIALGEIYEHNGNTEKAMRLNKLAVTRLLGMYKNRLK